MTLASCRGNLAQARALIANKQTVDGFPLDDRCKDWNILLCRKSVDWSTGRCSF
jgi:hypothetical protein